MIILDFRESREGLVFLEGIIIGLYGNWLILFLDKVSYGLLWHLLGVSLSLVMFVAFFIASMFKPKRLIVIIATAMFHFLATYGTLASEYLSHQERGNTLLVFTFSGVFLMIFLLMIEYKRSSFYSMERFQRKSITESVFRQLGIEMYVLVTDFLQLTQAEDFFGIDRTRDVNQQLAERYYKQLKRLEEEKIELNELGKKFFSSKNSYRRFQETKRILNDIEIKYSEFLTYDIRLSIKKTQEHLNNLIQLVRLRDIYLKDMSENEFFAKISAEIQSLAREADTMLTQEMRIYPIGNVFYH